MNGIHSSWIQVQAADRASNLTKMVIKNWDLNAPSYPAQDPWQFKLILNGCSTCSFDLMLYDVPCLARWVRRLDQLQGTSIMILPTALLIRLSWDLKLRPL